MASESGCTIFFSLTAFDFSKPRVGAFIDLRSCQFLHQIDFFLQSGIPIAFICSLDSSADGILATLRISDDTKRAIIPSPEERARFASNSASGWGRGVASSSEWSAVVGAVASLSEWDAAAAAASSSGWAAAGASMTGWGATDASSGEWGATSMGSGWGSVVKTVDWREVFTKRDRENGQTYDKGTKNQQNTWARRSYNARTLPNFRSGVPIYLWTNLNGTPTGWTRRKLQNHERVRKWEEYSDIEKVFDPYRKERHLLRELAEDRAPPHQRHRVYDDDHNDDRPEDEDFAFHSLLPPTPPCVIRR